MSRRQHPRRTVLRGIGTGAVLLAGGVGTTVADDDTDDQGDGRTAEVRVGHLSPDAPDVDVYVGKEPDGSPTISNLSYPTFAPNGDGSYLDLEAGTYDIAVTPAGSDSPQVIDVDDFELSANKNYTVLATGELNPEGSEPGIQALPLVDNGDDDDTALPPADAALVRLVHASPDAGTVDLVVEQNGSEVTTVDDVSFGDATDYLELDPGDYTLDVGPGALEVPLSLDAGTKVSGYVVGNASPESGDTDLSAVTTLDATNPSKGRGKGGGDGGDDGNGRGRGDGDRGRSS